MMSTQELLSTTPQPAGPEPIQSKITVVFYIGLKAVIGLSVPVEDFHDFHAVDVLHDGVVHFLPGGVVVSHLAHAGAVHHAHSQHAQREGAEGKQTKLPVREEHGHKYHHRHRQIGQPFRQGVGQQKFHALDVVNEHLLPNSNALLLDRAQGLLFQLALEMEPEVFQRMIGGAMRLRIFLPVMSIVLPGVMNPSVRPVAESVTSPMCAPPESRFNSSSCLNPKYLLVIDTLE